METYKDLIEMMISNFDHIKQMAERLTTGNVAHNSRTIAGIAFRCTHYLKDYLSEQEQWIPISEFSNEFDEEKVLIRTETGKVFRFLDNNLPMEEVTHFMIKDLNNVRNG